MTTTSEKQEKIALDMAASASKGQLVEKIVFAGIPILFSCVVYLMTALTSAHEKIERVEREAALARAAMTLDREKSIAAIEKSRMDMATDAAQARAAIRFDMMQITGVLDKRVTLLEKGK